MPGDRKVFRSAFEKWSILKADGCLSVPDSVGCVAILCSYFADYEGEYGLVKNLPKEKKLFRKEAFAIAADLNAAGTDTEIILNAKVADMAGVLTDPRISTVVTIGHGCLSAIDLGDREYDWLDASRDSDHLKTGRFIQRQCGIFCRDLNVPLGLFVVDDPASVIAAVGVPFEPRGLQHPANKYLGQVFGGGDVCYDSIKRDLSYIR